MAEFSEEDFSRFQVIILSYSFMCNILKIRWNFINGCQLKLLKSDRYLANCNLVFNLFNKLKWIYEIPIWQNAKMY